MAQREATFKQLAAGPQHACGILPDDTLTCWSNSYSPFGSPTGSFTRLAAAGFQFTCAISSPGALACWGDLPTRLPKSPTGSYKAIDVARTHAYAQRWQFVSLGAAA